MSAPQYPYPAPPPPPSSNSSMMTALAAGAIVASLAVNGFLLYELHDLRTETAKSASKSCRTRSKPSRKTAR